jgi:hypothetical protein
MASLFSNARRALDAEEIHGYSPNHRPEPRFTPIEKGELNMSRIRLLALAVLVELAVLAPIVAQQSAAAPTEHPMTLPSVDQHVKVLSDKLALTADQQEKARPIIAEMQDAMQKAMDDTSLTQEQQHARMHSAFMKADKEMRPFLTDEQKSKLDEMEKEHQGR